MTGYVCDEACETVYFQRCLQPTSCDQRPLSGRQLFGERQDGTDSDRAGLRAAAYAVRVDSADDVILCLLGSGGYYRLPSR